MECILTLGSIRKISLELWDSVTSCSDNHCDLLALIEDVTRHWKELDQDKARVLRAAFLDLSLDTVADTSVDVTRSGFIDLGWKPLAFLTDLKNGDPDKNQEQADPGAHSPE